ncbi:MAG TPA: hypothetical protein VHV10_01030, partial [Ktedonobacteraceae bacterium]|nr:hypothetical protein [Ktedonobacteraceae bacterium]
MAAIVAVIGVALLTRYAMGSGPSMPGLTVIGNAIPGHSITLKGNNFSAGHKVKVALDNQPLASGDQNKQVTETQHTSMMSILTLLASQAPPADNWITVNSDGTFTVIVPIDAHWDKGSKHSLSVYGQDNKLIASTGFQVVAPSLALCVVVGAHAAISLGPITEGDSQTVSTPFKLCSGGSGDLDWTSSWDQQQAPWLQLAQGGHLKAQQAQQIQISASAQNLTAGSYTADITFTGSPGNTKVALKVTLLVQPKNAPQTCIQADPSKLSFTSQQGQAAAASKDLVLTNCGDAGTWAAVVSTDDGTNWLQVSSTTNSINKGETQHLKVGASATQLSTGTYTGHIIFGTGPQSARVDVTLTVNPNPACITVDSQNLNVALTLGQDKSVTRNITLQNGNDCGAGSWSASSDASWLNTNPASGSVGSGGSANIKVGVSIAGLDLGHYTGHITLNPSSTTITVHLEVKRPPLCAAVSPDTLDFTMTQGDRPTNQGVTISNGRGCDSGPWSASSNASWLSTNPASGSLNVGGSVDIKVGVSASGLAPGHYTGHIAFNPGSLMLTVHLTILPPPCVAPSPDTLNFTMSQGDGPASQGVTISNGNGCGAGSWSASSNASWLSIHLAGGQINVGGSVDASVAVSVTGLAPGKYTGHITLSPGSAMLTVHLTVLPPPCPTPSPSTLNFSVSHGGGSSSQNVTISNGSGCGAGSWSASSDVSWLNVGPAGGSINASGSATVSVRVSTAGLAPGKYTGHITFGPGSAMLTVNLTV